MNRGGDNRPRAGAFCVNPVALTPAGSLHTAEAQRSWACFCLLGVPVQFVSGRNWTSERIALKGKRWLLSVYLFLLLLLSNMQSVGVCLVASQ